MKITKQDQNLMILKDRNIIAFIVGIIFVLAGFLVIFKPGFFANQPPMWSGLVGVLLGSFVILVAKIPTISLDKTSNKLLFFLRQGLTIKSTKEYNLDQIKEIELSVIYTPSGKGSGYSHHLAFVLNNGEVVPLNSGSSSIIRIMGKQTIPEKNIGARIADFLNIPFRERRLPTVGETLSAVSSAVQSAAEKEMEKENKRI